MTSPNPVNANDQETLKQLLRDRIAQLESRGHDPPRSPDELAADDAFQVASTAARQLVADTDIPPDEKLRILQLMFTDCLSNVRALEHELGLEEKRLSVAELDYNELGDDLRKIEASTDKLKALSRELSKQNKAMIDESEKRTAEERGKREEIVDKFDEAMKDINARLNTGDFVDGEKDELASSLEADLEKLQAQYEEREKFYEKSLSEAIEKERTQSAQLRDAQQAYEKDDLALVTERRKLIDVRKKSTTTRIQIENITEKKNVIEQKTQQRQTALKRHEADIKRIQQSEADLKKAMQKLNAETEELKAKSKDMIAKVKSLEEDLEFWKAKSKSERDKRETLERLCRTLTEERTIMRKEVQAMQQAWQMLENEIENLRMEINEPEKS